MTASSFNGKAFGDMSSGEKVQFTLKLIAFVCTFGFAFPTLLHSDDYVAKYR